MTQYSYSQLEKLWEQAGGNPLYAPLAAAIAMAESGGNSSASNFNTNGTTDRGLWQINSIWGSESTYDPIANARAAVSISQNGSNWTPWVTYNTGAYRQFLQGNVPPSSNLPQGGGSPAQLTSKTGGGGINWWSFIPEGIIGNLLLPGQGYVPGAGGNPLTEMVSAVKMIAADFATIAKWMAWLFAPSNWVRIGAFVFGIIAMGASFYMFKEAL